MMAYSNIAPAGHPAYQVLWPVSRSELAALTELGLSAGQIASYFGVPARNVFEELQDQRLMDAQMRNPRAGTRRSAGDRVVRGRHAEA